MSRAGEPRERQRRCATLPLRLALGSAIIASLTGCTLHHSKQALWAQPTEPPSAKAVFVSEEDSGLSLLGLLLLSEPDHYTVLLERARRRHRCAKLSHAQLDFYTDHWAIVAFPIARITMVCERSVAAPSPAAAASSRTP